VLLVADAKFVLSVGVNTPVMTVVPDAEGIQEHLATKGATVVVGTASQPVTAFALTEKATNPDALAVPLITIGPRSKTPFPPETISVDAAGSAYAAPPVTAPPTIANVTIAKPEITFFITTPSIVLPGLQIILF
jgi:hypothetical protein